MPRPILEFSFKIPFVNIYTTLWQEGYTTCTLEYIILNIELFNKWKFHFRLYKTI